MPRTCISPTSSSVSVSSTSAGSSSPSEHVINNIEGDVMKKTKTKKNKKRGIQARANHEARKRERRNISHQAISGSPLPSPFGCVTGSYAVSGNQLVQDDCSIHRLAVIANAEEVGEDDKSYDPEGLFTRPDQFLEFNTSPSYNNTQGEYFDMVAEKTVVASDHWDVFPEEAMELQEKELSNDTTSEEAVVEQILELGQLLEKVDITQVDKSIDEFVEEIDSKPISNLYQVEVIQVDEDSDTPAETDTIGPVLVKSMPAETEIVEETTIKNITIEDITIEDPATEDTITKEDMNKPDNEVIRVPKEAVAGPAMDEPVGIVKAAEPLAGLIDVGTESKLKYSIFKDVLGGVGGLVNEGPRACQEIIVELALKPVEEVVTKPLEDPIKESLGDIITKKALAYSDESQAGETTGPTDVSLFKQPQELNKALGEMEAEQPTAELLEEITKFTTGLSTEEISSGVDVVSREDEGGSSTHNKTKSINGDRAPISKADHGACKKEKYTEMRYHAESCDPSPLGFSLPHTITGDQLSGDICLPNDLVDASPTFSHGDHHRAYDNSIYNFNGPTEGLIPGPQSPSFLSEDLAPDSLDDNDIKGCLLGSLNDSHSQVSANPQTPAPYNISGVPKGGAIDPDTVEPVILGREIGVGISKDYREVLMEVIKSVGHVMVGKVINGVTAKVLTEVTSEALHVTMGPKEVLILGSEQEGMIGTQIIQKYNERIRALEAEVSKKDSEIRDEVGQRMRAQQSKEDLENSRDATERLSKRDSEEIIEVAKEIAEKERENTKSSMEKEKERAENAAKREFEIAEQLVFLTEAIQDMREQHTSGVMNLQAENMKLQKTIDTLIKQNHALKAKVDADNELLKSSYKIVRNLKDRFKVLVQASDTIDINNVRMPRPTLSIVNSGIKELKQLMQTNENIEYEQALARKGKSDAIDAALLKIDREKMAKDFALWETKCQKFGAGAIGLAGDHPVKPVIAIHADTIKDSPRVPVTNIVKGGSNPINQSTTGSKASVKKHGHKGRSKGKNKAVAIVNAPVFTGGIPEGVDFEDGIRKLIRRTSPNFGDQKGRIGGGQFQA